MIDSIAYSKGIGVVTYIEFRKIYDLRLFLNPDELQQAIRNIVINGNHNLFFNKKYNLVYGKFLKEFINENKTHKIKILYYKQPSFIHKVEYTSIIYELLQTHIDEHDEALNKLVKKLIVNVNFGLLEKGGATAHQSILFNCKRISRNGNRI